MKKNLSARNIALIGILGAITVVLGLTPLGFIPVGPAMATIMHIPVIIGAIMGGPVVGGFVGLIFGVSSYFNAIMRPMPTSFVFLNPIVSVLPRILIGLVSAYVYKTFKNSGKVSGNIGKLIGVLIVAYLGYNLYGAFVDKNTVYVIANAILIVLTISVYFLGSQRDMDMGSLMAAASGTLTNTVLVLGLIYLIYGKDFVAAMGQDVKIAKDIIIGIGIMNGIPELIVSIILVTTIMKRINIKKLGR